MLRLSSDALGSISTELHCLWAANKVGDQARMVDVVGGDKLVCHVEIAAVPDLRDSAAHERHVSRRIARSSSRCQFDTVKVFLEQLVARPATNGVTLNSLVLRGAGEA